MLRDDILARSDLAAAVQARDCDALAAAMSVGRTRLVPRLVGERGILDVLGPVGGDSFLSTLEAITLPELLPEPLRPYFGTIRRGVTWLHSEGLDVGSTTTRNLLDALVATGVLSADAVGKIKALAEVPHDLTAREVAEALYNDDGSLI